MTVSAGLGEYRPELSQAEFFRLVDHALYRAKKLGRDQHQVAHRDIDELEQSYLHEQS